MKKSVVSFATIFLLYLMGIPAWSIAQRTSDVDPDLEAIQNIVAPVKVDGEIIFYVRGISSNTAPERAKSISKRIVAAADDDSVSADSMKVVKGEDRIQIFADRHFIMNVYEADALREGIKQVVLAEMLQQKIKSTVIRYRNDRSSSVLLKKTLYAMGALLLFAALLYGFMRLLRWLNVLIHNQISSRIESMEHKSFNLIRSGQFWKAFSLFFRIIKIGTIIVLVAFFVQYTLGLFPWTNSIAVYILNLFLEPIVQIGKAFVNFLPSLAFLLVIYVVTRYLLKLIRLFFTGIQLGDITISSFKPEWSMPTYKILRLFVIAFAVVIAYPYIPGSESSAFKGVSVFLGVLLSLGSSSVIGNLIAGYSMVYRGAFQIGDLVKVDEHIGFVEEQKLMVTRLRSFKNEVIVVPNSELQSSHIINYSAKAKEQGLILHTNVGIGYETPWRQVEAMLKQAAARTEGLLQNPPPFVHQRLLGDFAVTYELNVYCNDAAVMYTVYTRLHQHILDVFNENNVQIMTPAYEGDPEIPKVVPPELWHTPLAKNS